jgi:hypothetical protein
MASRKGAQQIHSPAIQRSDNVTAASLIDNPVVRQLRDAVVEDRNRISDIINDVRQMRTETEERDLRSSPGPPYIPPFPTPISSRSKRPLYDPGRATPPKRFRTGSQQHPDVLYGPVDPDGDPKAIANAAMDLIFGLQPNDVFSSKYVHNQPGTISIRFRNHDAAQRFIESIEADPLLEGQLAFPAGAGSMTPVASPAMGPNRQSTAPNPRDILRGSGRNPRRR